MKTLLSALSCASMIALSACSSMPEMPQMPALAIPALPAFGGSSGAGDKTATADAGSATPASMLRRAIDLLGAGREDDAKRALQQVLVSSPRNATAASLLNQIDTDPAVLLGETGDTYVVAAGDTMSELAGRFLDDPLMFYALSRYNGLAAPNALSEGKVLKLPARSRSAIEATASNVPVSTPSKAAEPSDVVAARANAARMKGLESLNAGNVDLAVSLLKEAQRLSVDDAAIGRDLERALRIQAALQDG